MQQMTFSGHAETGLTLVITNLPNSGLTAEGKTVAFTGTLNGWDTTTKTSIVSGHRLVYTFSNLGSLSALGSDWSDAPQGANAGFQFVEPGSWNRAVKSDFNLNDGNFRICLTEGIVNTVTIDASPVPTLVDQSSAVCVNGVVERPIRPIDQTVFMYPGGRWKALIMSYDDGHDQDRGLVPILNAHGIKGTFHLNSNSLGYDTFITAGEVGTLFAGHEVSSHTVDHPYLDQLGSDSIRWEIGTDCNTLGGLAGYSIRSMSYPFGAFNNTIMSIASELGVRSSRTTLDQYTLTYLPPNPLKWHPTCHHSAAWAMAEAFTARTAEEMSLLFIWGHSYELDYGYSNNSWTYLSSLCAMIGNRGDTWYAGMSEVCDYLTALRSVTFPSGHCIYNPSSLTIWAKLNGVICRIQPGKRMTFPAGRVDTDPSVPVEHETMMLRYVPDGSNDLASAASVIAHVGHDGWQDVLDIPMTKTPDGAWTCAYPVGAGWSRVNAAFTDGAGVWDDHGGSDWALAVRRATAGTPAGAVLQVSSPMVAGTPVSGQNNPGETVDVHPYAGCLSTKAQGGFGSFGSVYISGDETNLYLCAKDCRTDGTNNAQILFLSVDTLSGGAENFWSFPCTPNGLHYCHNLALSPAAHIAILIGDEYGDGTYSHFKLENEGDFGQGVFYLASEHGAFIPVPGARLSQFDGSGTNRTASADDDGNRMTDRWELAIPWQSLGAANGYRSVRSLYISGVIAGDAVSSNNRYLSSNYLGDSATGTLDELGNFGFNFVTLAATRIGMPYEDSDRDGMTDAHETLAGTNPADADSSLQLHTAPLENGRPGLCFDAAAGRRYRIQYTDALKPGSAWQDFGGILTAATGTTCSITNLLEQLSTAFYRVHLVTP